MVVEDLSKIFGSKTKAREILLLLAGVKPLVRQAFYSHEIVFKEFLEKHDVFMVVSPYYVKLKEDGFANKGELSSDGYHFVYFSKSEELCFRAALAEAKGDHVVLGGMLGYPKCCIEYFLSEFPNNVNPQIDSEHWQLNLSKRGEDAVLLSHFPCQDCSESLQLAKIYFDVLSELDEMDAVQLKGQLSL